MQPIDYYTTHAEIYDTQFSGTDDLAFYVDMAAEPSVELGVGTGRIAIAIAEAGTRVIGVDPFSEMLSVARQKLRAQGLLERVDLVQGDMRSFALGGQVPLVLIPAQVFMHNLTTEDQLATLHRCFELLAPGGKLVIDVFNPDPALTASTSGDGAGNVWHALPERHVWSEWSTRCWPTRQLSQLWYRGERDGRPATATYTLRWVYRFEMEHLLERAGFEIVEVYGDYERSALMDDSPRMVWVAAKPEQ